MSIARIASSIATTIMIATPTPKIVIVLSGIVIAGCGVAVGAAGSTANAALACDGQYDSEPAKVAMTVYLPSMSGLYCKLNAPLESKVTTPMSR
jgi:hypothetical protein